MKLKLQIVSAVVVGAVLVAAGVFVLQSSDDDHPTLTIATVNNQDMVVMQSLSSKFTDQTGIKINWETLPENTLRQKVKSDLETGAGKFDIATAGNYDIPLWAKAGWIENLNPHFSQLNAADSKAYDLQDVLPKVRVALSHEEGLYALPFYGESSMTFYNKKLFAAAGLTMPLHPTWDEIAALAAKLDNKGQGQSGICMRALPGWGEFGGPLTTVVNTFGGQWFNMNWEPQLTSPAFVKAVKFYVDMVKSHGEPNPTSSGFNQCETAMANSKSAIWVDATVAAGLLTNAKDSPAANDIGFAYAPTQVTPNGANWLWTWSLAIESSSKNKDAAFEFLTWATSKDYQKLVADKNGWASVPPGTRTSTYQNPDYQKAASGFADIVLNSMLTADPTKQTLNPVPYKGIQFVAIPEFEQIGTQVTTNLAAAVTGSTSVEDALALSQQQVTEIMKKAGYPK